MSTEVLIDDDYDGKKADIWSVGVTTYIMATGTPLFHDVSEVVAVRLQNARIQIPSYIHPFIAQLIYEMLSPDPDERPSAAEIYEILEEKCPLYIQPLALRQRSPSLSNNKILPALHSKGSIFDTKNHLQTPYRKFDVRMKRDKNSMNQIPAVRPNLLLETPSALSRSAHVFKLKDL